MELRSEEKQEKENKGKKIIIISIIILIALIILLGVAIVVLNNEESKKTKLSVDGKLVKISSTLIVTDETTGTDYYSIKGIANLTKYNFYNGEYNKYSEDRTKCYVTCTNEIATMEQDSDIIYKKPVNNKTGFYEYKLNNKIVMFENALYATLEDLQTIFNTKVKYNKSSNTISISTLPYLVDYYKGKVTSYGYKCISSSFDAQKAIIKDLLVVNKDDKYGVISTKTMGTVIGNKFEDIDYIESTDEFIVKSNGKMGTLSIDGKTKIGLGYEEVGLIDSNSRIYYAKNNNLYGVLNDNGKVLVYIQYTSIGIEDEYFPMADIKNRLILLDNCIALKKDKKWGIADKNGNIIVDVEYDKIGYIEESLLPKKTDNTQSSSRNTPTPTLSAEKSINNVITVPEIEGIVVGKNNKYGVINKIGKTIIPCEYDKIYSITNEGKEDIYLEKDGRTTKLSKYLEENRIIVQPTTTPTPPTPEAGTNTNNTVNNSTTTNTSKDKNEMVVVL